MYNRIALSLCLMSLSCGRAPELPEYRSAEVKLFDASHEKNFSLLPSAGNPHPSKNFWSGSVWSQDKALINWRWNSPLSETSDYSSPYQIQIFLMTLEELAALSPAEKFDLLMGRYNFPLKEEVYGFLKKNFDSIYAWQVASFFHKEPQIKTLINPDGLAIPFGSSDIKALLTYHYGLLHPPKITQSIGRFCDEDGCNGTLDAGTFHLTLSNKLGKSGEAFFIDLDPSEKVKGRLAIKFSSSIVDEFPPTSETINGTTKVLKIINRVTFLESTKTPSWEPSGASYFAKEYSYYLYLNLKNEVIGGKWITNNEPDSLWVVKESEGFSDLLAGLDQLISN